MSGLGVWRCVCTMYNVHTLYTRTATLTERDKKEAEKSVESTLQGALFEELTAMFGVRIEEVEW